MSVCKTENGKKRIIQIVSTLSSKRFDGISHKGLFPAPENAFTLSLVLI